MLILTELIFAIKHSIVESILPRSDHDWFDWTDSSVFELIFPGSKPDCFFLNFFIFNPDSLKNISLCFAHFIWSVYTMKSHTQYFTILAPNFLLHYFYIPSTQYSVLK